jgi:hypothetical protein
MHIGVVGPNARPNDGAALWAQRFAQHALGHQVSYIGGEIDRIGPNESSFDRHLYGRFELIRSRMTSPFRGRKWRGGRNLRFPTIPPEKFREFFADVYAGSPFGPPDIVIMLNSNEYASRNMVKGMADLVQDSNRMFIAPMTEWGDSDVFDFFGHFIFSSERQREWWARRFELNGVAARHRHKVRAAPIVPPFLDLHGGWPPGSVRRPEQSDEFLRLLMPVHLGDVVQAQRVIEVLTLLRSREVSTSRMRGKQLRVWDDS